MVEELSVRCGLDIRTDGVRVANVEYGAARPSITKLGKVEAGAVASEGNDVTTIAIADAEAIIKEIKLPPDTRDQLTEKAEFELRHRLLDPSEQFALETIPTGRKTRFIGTAIRHEIGQRRLADTGFNFDKNNTGWRVRSLALGFGYLNFCSDRTESLAALIEITDTGMAICFIYRSEIIALDHIVSNGHDLTSESDQKELVVDLKTIVNYRLSALFEDGLTLPLSEIMICSEIDEPSLIDRLANSFKVSVSAPVFNNGYLAESVNTESIRPIDYLVALGLTVK